MLKWKRVYRPASVCSADSASFTQAGLIDWRALSNLAKAAETLRDPLPLRHLEA